MDRLTFYDKSGEPCYKTMEYVSFYQKEISVVISGTDVARKLASYEDAEEQGLSVRLPCKVGDTVYVINCYCGECENSDEFAAVIDVGVSCPIGYTEKCAMRIDEESFLLGHYEEIGKTVFLTREEAEQALCRKGED